MTDAVTTTPVAVVQTNRPLVALAAGANRNLLHSTDGSMTTWGGNSSGQLGSNNTQASAAPVDVDTSALQHGGFIMFAASGCASSHNLAVFAVPVDVPAGLLEPSGLKAWRLEHFADIGVGHPLPPTTPTSMAMAFQTSSNTPSASIHARTVTGCCPLLTETATALRSASAAR